MGHIESELSHYRRIRRKRMAKKKCAEKVITDCKVTPLIDLRAEYDEGIKKKEDRFRKDVEKETCILLSEVESYLVKNGGYTKAVHYNSGVQAGVLYRLQQMYSEAGYIASTEVAERLKYASSLSYSPLKVKMLELTIKLKK